MNSTVKSQFNESLLNQYFMYSPHLFEIALWLKIPIFNFSVMDTVETADNVTYSQDNPIIEIVLYDIKAIFSL